VGPGRVKTQSVLWFPLLNRGGMMKGFVQGADRQFWRARRCEARPGHATAAKLGDNQTR